MILHKGAQGPFASLSCPSISECKPSGLQEKPPGHAASLLKDQICLTSICNSHPSGRNVSLMCRTPAGDRWWIADRYAGDL